jgi:hypothetical protein
VSPRTNFTKQKKRIISYPCQGTKPRLSKPQPKCHTHYYDATHKRPELLSKLKIIKSIKKCNNASLCAVYNETYKVSSQVCPRPISTASATWPICDSLHVTLSITLVSKQKFFLLPVKIQGDSQTFDITESKYDSQIAWSSTNGKGRD